MYQTWYQISGLIASGKLDLEKIVTHAFPLERIDEAMAIMASGNSGKIVLIP
ncbi:MAG: hypothetical protein IH571_00405 [Acholeplasmataceae bacterium]|nr:hypothetical protein [Acholeplasmataceae bacterium]